VAAAVAGALRPATEEEALNAQPARRVTAEVVTEEVKRDGKASARVLINERPALLIRAASGGRSPAQRAAAAAKVLRDWMKGPIAPNEIDRQPVQGGWAVRVKGKVVAVATPADGKAAGGTPDQVAKKWLVGIRQGVAIAARPAGGTDTPKPKPATGGGCETGG
jgi:hypothetical protein